MNWNDIAEGAATEYREFLEGYKEAREHLETDKAMLLEMTYCTEATAPPFVKDKLIREAENFQQNWGKFGHYFKIMRIAHQKEIDDYFKKQELNKDLLTDKAKDKIKGRDGGR